MISAAAAMLIGLCCWAVLAWKDRIRHRREVMMQEPAAEIRKQQLRDYRVYRLNARERWAAVIGAGLVFAAIGFIFYSSYTAAAIGMTGGWFIPKFRGQWLREQRLLSLRVQFKQALYAVSSSLSAGKSVEQAFADAVQDMRLLYPQGTSLMIEELEVILHKLQLGGTIEAAVADFSRRSGLEDAVHFADVFAVCKRTGGNLIEIVRRTASIIGEKLEIEQDIAVLLAQKKFESRVLLAAPLVIVAVLRATAAEYMAPLYQGGGRITMTAALLMLAGCMWLTAKLIQIRV